MLNLSFSGHVVKGEGIATGLGCPTANIAVTEGVIIPGLGVYVGEAKFDGKSFPAVICINDGRTGLFLKMEVHLVSVDPGNLDGKFMQVNLFEKIRDLLTWESTEQMRELVAGDLHSVREWFIKHQDIYPDYAKIATQPLAECEKTYGE